MIFDCIHSSGKEGIVETELNKLVKSGKSLGDQAIKNKRFKWSKTIAFDFFLFLKTRKICTKFDGNSVYHQPYN